MRGSRDVNTLRETDVPCLVIHCGLHRRESRNKIFLNLFLRTERALAMDRLRCLR